MRTENELKRLLNDRYGMELKEAIKSQIGAGLDTYFITCDSGKYVIKFPSISSMNNPETEPPLCEFLRKKGIHVSEFIRNKEGEFLSQDTTGRMFHLQRFVEGKVYELNTAPEWVMRESASTLGKIHTALMEYHGLPEGIGQNFFHFMTPERAQKSYMATLEKARQKKDAKIEEDLIYRLQFLKHFPEQHFDLNQLSMRSTHGDYFISQLICGENSIHAVIDWTMACMHPAVWEIIRSFVYGDSDCRNGEIVIPKFIAYVKEYLKYATLTHYDLITMPRLFCYQIAVCDYYNQYYESVADNREIYLGQAVFSTKLMRWFEAHMEELVEEMKKL
ncbi:MAG: aminoglycoside phosphotransferase [Lachnospiraceae bacterium]|nr:aminoglycoside phosphotransferase [Lachnospiraceae bacterium]